MKIKDLGIDETLFKKDQLNEIELGLELGNYIELSIEQIRIYTDPKYNWEQMREIRLGFRNGLTLEQVNFYADPKYNYDQMWEIREGLENGLSIEA